MTICKPDRSTGIQHVVYAPYETNDINLNTLKYSFDRLLMTIFYRPFAPRGATKECAGTTICMTPS